MHLLTQTESLMILGVFGAVMIVIVWLKEVGAIESADRFLVRNRDVGVIAGAFSIAVTWIWAPAIFVCSLQSYTKGLPGIFWFTAPNILCFFLFAPLGVRLRRLLPQGYTLPEFIYRRFGGDKKTHLAFLCVFFGYQLGAMIINTLAGGTLMHALSGLDIRTAILCTVIPVLAYSLISGMVASILTDVIQMSMILVIGFVIVPLAVFKAGGWSSVTAGVGGVTGEYTNLFDPWIAYTMGIPMSLGLLAGPIGDQMFFQRSMSARIDKIVKTFVIGGLVFGVVPIALSLLGFIAANPAISPSLTVDDPQMVGPIVVGHFLPRWALVGFCFMALAGLASTLDASYIAVSSLAAVDVYKHYINQNPTDRQIVKVSRYTMFAMTVLGTAIAMLQPKLLWVFLIYGALASAGMFPTALSLCWKKLNSRGAFWAVALSLGVGTPLSIYANITENAHLIVVAAIASVAIGLVVCLYFGFTNKEEEFDFGSLAKPISQTTALQEETQKSVPSEPSALKW
jgi:Na+/proline symporter